MLRVETQGNEIRVRHKTKETGLISYTFGPVSEGRILPGLSGSAAGDGLLAGRGIGGPGVGGGGGVEGLGMVGGHHDPLTIARRGRETGSGSTGDGEEQGRKGCSTRDARRPTDGYSTIVAVRLLRRRLLPWARLVS